MRKWERTTISEVADLIAGFAFKSKDFGDFQDKVVKIKDITPPTFDTINAEGVNINFYSLEKLKKYKISYGDYVLAMTGATIGKVGRYIAAQESYINQRVLKFCPHFQKCDKIIHHTWHLIINLWFQSERKKCFFLHPLHL